MKKIIKLQKHEKKLHSYTKSLTLYIRLIVCHELGHRDDEEEKGLIFSEYLEEMLMENDEKFILVDEYCEDIKENCIKKLISREVTAWNLGKKYVPENEINAYDLMNQDYIQEK